MTDNATAAKIFISYRRADSADICGRIYDRLAQHFGKAAIFKDVDNIPFGADFPRHIETILAQCAVELVVIGPRWLEISDDKGRRRLDDPEDFVRIEVERGLSRDILVIPLLVTGASMPGTDQLPPGLAGLVRRNAVPVRADPDFHKDMGRLIGQLEAVVPPLPAGPPSLADAERRLASLPLDDIPDLAPLPPGSRMPLTSNPLFVGREEDFKTLAKAMKGGETVAIGQVQIAAATGLGGIGKTQLAVEFVHRYGQYFAGGFFWLSFADPKAIPAEVAACGERGGLDLPLGFSNLPLDDQVRLVLSAWQSPLPRLLVFDNCEKEELLARWRPPTGGCRVLVTSHRATWDVTLGVQALPLGVLSRAESVALLRKFRPELAEDDAKAIAEELGDLPLALHLAGSYLARYRHAVTPKDYLTQLRAPNPLAHRSLQAGGISPTQHAQHVARTFVLSYDRLDPADPADALALALLGRASYFAPGEPIPRDLLRATLDYGTVTKLKTGLWMKLRNLLRIGNPTLETRNQKLETEQGEDGLARLVELGLLEAEAEGALRLHRLVTAFVRGVAADAEAQEVVEETLFAEAARLNEAGYPAPLLAWQSHLRAVTDAAQKREDERAARLCNALGYHLHVIGDYARARPYYERALRIREQVLGEEHPDTAQSLNNLGGLLQALGDLAGACPYCERALRIREKVLGGEHPDTAASLNNLGGLLKAQGDLAGARPYYERALRIYEQVLGGEHPDTALSLNNLGLLLYAMGDLAGARPYLERALRITEKVLGEEHPDTALSLNNLGYVLQAQGDLAGARPYLERALRITEKVLGEEHPDTALSLNNLGALLYAMGDLAGARPYCERALRIREQVLGEEHPDTAQSLNNLGGLLQDQGDLAGARPYCERALRIYEKVLGEEHPDTAHSLNNLGLLLQAQGDLAGARPYLERALRITEHVLGGEHPDTAQSLNNLSSLLYAMGDLAGARPYLERALRIFEARLGPDHPYTCTVRNNLAILNAALKD
jgi:tetratricopeptide (TPR) repeat protein